MATLQQAMKPLFSTTLNRYSKELKNKYIITTDNSGNITGKISVGALISGEKYAGGEVAEGVFVTKDPQAGDILFLDEDGLRVFVKNANDELVKANLPEGWTLVGYVFHRGKTDLIAGETDDLSQVWVLNKERSTNQWLSLWQYAVTNITSTDISLKFRMVSDFKSYTTVTVSLTSTEINATTAAEISAAVRAKAVEIGALGTWWAYLDAENNRIIVQNDVCESSYQYLCTGATGCTCSLCVWEGTDYLDNAFGYRKDGTIGSGGLNDSKYTSYIKTNGSSDTTLGLVGTIMSENAFNNSENSQVIEYKAGGKTYADYISEYKMVEIPQRGEMGLFELPTAKEQSAAVAWRLAPTRDGGTKPVFAAMYYCYSVDYGVEGLGKGDWFLAGIQELSYLMQNNIDSDFAYGKTYSSINKMGSQAIGTAPNIFMSQRSSNSSVYIYYGSRGNYTANGTILGDYRCFPVTCLYL